MKLKYEQKLLSKGLSFFLNFVFFVSSFVFFVVPLQTAAQNPSENQQQTQQQTQPADTLSATLTAERLAALTKLKTQLTEIRRQNRADLTMILNDGLFNKIFAELTQTKFNAAGLFEITITNPRVQLLNGLALVRMQAQLTPTNSLMSVTNNLDVTARLLVEQDEQGALNARIQVVDLKSVAAGDQPALSLISPQQLSGLLPPFKLPLQLDFDQTLRPGPIKQTKPIVYDVTIEPRRIRGRFEVVELLPLANRLVMLARIKNLTVTRGAAENPKNRAPEKDREKDRSPERPKPQKLLQPISYQQPSENAPAVNSALLVELDRDIEDLSIDLRAGRDLGVRIEQQFLRVLMDEVARASTRDLLIKIYAGRVYSSKSDLGFTKYENYLDLDGGDGVIDLRDADVDSLKNGRMAVFIELSGQVQAQAHGKQLGFSYNANPQIGISMKDQFIFIIEPAGKEFRLRPGSKQAKVHLDINVPVPALGTGVNASQDISFDLASVMKPITLPQVIDTGFKLPKTGQTLTLSEANYQIEFGRLLFEANLQLIQQKPAQTPAQTSDEKPKLTTKEPPKQPTNK